MGSDPHTRVDSRFDAGSTRVKPAAHVVELPHVTSKPASRVADFVMLTKPRLNLLVLMTTLTGLYLAAPDGVPPAILLHTLIGTALVAGGAAALNQAWERETDALMQRTQVRPVAAGRMRVSEGAWFGA